MLRQILNDMYVDPEILSGLDEYQKQTLFCKMREEQIRRWRVREQENDSRATSTKKSTPNKKNKNVSFREDDEGEPWVVVIEPAIFTDSDSDDSDLSMKKPGHEEAKQRARELAEIETKELRRQYKEIITDLDNNDTNCKKDKVKLVATNDEPLIGTPIIDDMEIYCSVDELRERMNQSKLSNGIPPTTKLNLKNGNLQKNNIINFSFSDNQNEKNVILKEINSNNKPTQKVSAKIALWEQRVIGEKTTEIYQRLRKKQKEQAQEEAKKQEEAWKEQERKAKEADIQFREITRRAREEHRKSLNSDETTSIISASTPKSVIKNGAVNGTITNGVKKPNGIVNGMNGTNGFVNGIHPMTNGTSTKGPAPQPPSTPSTMSVTQPQPSSSPPSSLDVLIPRPASHDKMIQWYHDVEIAKGAGLDSVETHLPCKWFYGLMSRTEAEQLLESEPMGTFLVRLSEKIWGYAISYKDSDRCKHYLINASTGQYKFLGANQMNHTSLNNLIKHHATVPITAMGNELLIRPCPRSGAVNSKIFDGLF
ncbi:SH2 domain-containing protein 4A-like [Sitodiplosis mosellana]|uniref:SH2 domain-containing protein 4A-like n=1 Tax=Sitodiplosis mosellana TaxID=263140 RepID=UPI002443CD01|nr:SH2 domain-containing protein 4A-like [Sitodiplosis mosellana]XP_055314388.1 SH2 domain-containing protein 4A-like [Sitodiplosis mosellana]XP_055314389.1 SH2 domain-containing protein 4A-like [Sitodiplosis mosellana]XP_055314390.1 SH2 domain-containing protein 4A-like [Sitodiplosis mosellana]XP_055314391.1 SH2 domain-containing protein 4A-like [Sitodiplosis mosellana]XP_055314392.1 SH2 domain-containing protein 4A-like [Sitodiplosis mosellana]XP_055314393.1 SH2 domain-containing protein 4A